MNNTIQMMTATPAPQQREETACVAPVEGQDLPLSAGDAAALEAILNRDEMLHLSRLIAMGQLTACFAHEVNNALSLIQGSLTIAREMLPANHPVLSNLDVIGRSAKQIDEMSKRMLAFGRTRSSRLQVHDVKAIVEEAIQIMQPYLRCNNLTVTVNLPSWLPKVRIERWQIIQALVNLLRNAGDAIGKSNRREICVTVVQAGSSIRIAVCDTGCGIARQNLSKVFTPFFTTKGDRGTGLGLYITKKIVEDHGGSISVDSNSRGTTFTVSLPLLQGKSASYSP